MTIGFMPIARDGAELHAAHLERAVADEHDRAEPRQGRGDAEHRRHGKPERAVVGRPEEADAVLDMEIGRAEQRVAGIGDHDVVLLEERVDLGEERLDPHRRIRPAPPERDGWRARRERRRASASRGRRGPRRSPPCGRRHRRGTRRRPGRATPRSRAAGRCAPCRCRDSCRSSWRREGSCSRSARHSRGRSRGPSPPRRRRDRGGRPPGRPTCRGSSPPPGSRSCGRRRAARRRDGSGAVPRRR